MEIFEYATEGLKWLVLGGGSYVALMLGSEFLSTTLFHKKIQSQKELDTIVEEEAHKLGLDPAIIDAEYNGMTDGVIKICGRYELDLQREFYKTRSTVRHELYHIYRGDCEQELNALRYIFIQEPRAKIYELTGLKL